MDNILVVGAKPGSLGEAIAYALGYPHPNVRTAGISGEDFGLDITGELEGVMRVLSHPWNHVVCTAGINEETIFPNNEDWAFRDDLEGQFEVNCFGPMRLLNLWLQTLQGRRVVPRLHYHHFVVVSSNSAHVPRSTGMGYCASKAALSQAVRCAARAVPSDVCVWALEPGWIADTPMSVDVLKRLTDPAKIMRGGDMASRLDIAEFVRAGLDFGAPRVLNGMTITLDGGER